MPRQEPRAALEGWVQGSCLQCPTAREGRETAPAANPVPLQPFPTLAQQGQLQFCLFLMKANNQFLAIHGDAIQNMRKTPPPLPPNPKNMDCYKLVH